MTADLVTVLGIDIGGGTGYCLGTWQAGKRKASEVHAWQCDQASSYELLDWILATCRVTGAQAEAFVSGPRSVAMRGMKPQVMHGQLADLVTLLDEAGIPCGLRAAAGVKKWATDERLRAAGLLDAAHKTGRHAQDAARHCLFRAVQHLGVPDPLSRRSTA